MNHFNSFFLVVDGDHWRAQQESLNPLGLPAMLPNRTSWGDFITTSAGRVRRYASSPTADPLAVSAEEDPIGSRKINVPVPQILLTLQYQMKVQTLPDPVDPNYR
jgi:hypothetical protein